MPSYVVTGAARGIGLEFSRQLSLDQNNTVFALVRDKSTAEKLVDLKRSNLHIFEADITDRKNLKAAAHEVAKITGGKLDYLINNAAFVDKRSTLLMLDEYEDEEDMEQDLVHTFTVNVVGVVNTINAFLPLLRKGETKKVISLSSGLADLDPTLNLGFAGQAPYCISKAALNMVVAKYAAKFKSEGFVFLALSPGLVNTAVKPPTAKQIEEFQVLGNLLLKIQPGFKGPITPEESVKMQLEVINKWTVEGSGAFVSHHGDKEWL